MAGQSVSQIRALLDAAGLAPRRQYGQNFLIDLNLMRKLVSAAEVRSADVVLEVGCGTGSLTEHLLETGARVVGVEIDHGLQAILRERFGDAPRFTLIQGDALAAKHTLNPLILNVLRENPPAPGGAYKLVANLPYQIATPLLIDLLLTTLSFDVLCCTIQREVGERLGAQPDTEAYGPVSVIMQSLTLIRPIAILPPRAFWPRPKVESVMVEIRPKPTGEVEVEDPAGFAAFVRRGFAQRRKMLRGVVERWGLADVELAFLQAGVSGEARPGDVAPAQWRMLWAHHQPESPS